MNEAQFAYWTIGATEASKLSYKDLLVAARSVDSETTIRKKKSLLDLVATAVMEANMSRIRRMQYEVSTPKVKKARKTAEPAKSVEELLSELKVAREAKDPATCKRIRSSLRRQGYYISKV